MTEPSEKNVLLAQLLRDGQTPPQLGVGKTNSLLGFVPSEQPALAPLPEPPPLPLTPSQMFAKVLELPLYTPVTLHTNANSQVAWLRKHNEGYDRYCPTCKRETPWTPMVEKPIASSSVELNLWAGPFKMEQFCRRCRTSAVMFMHMAVPTRGDAHVETGPGKLMKVGQMPSLAEFHRDDLAKFNDVTTEQQREDFTRAIQAASQGFAAGACTYLRRVLENVLNEARDTYMSAHALTDWPAYKEANSTAKKIKLLKDELPAFLTENTRLYNLLSQGIHSLPDAECQELYPQLREAIELVLEERQDVIERKRRRDRTAKFIKQADNPKN